MIDEGTAVGYADAFCQLGSVLDTFVLEDARYRPENHKKYLEEIDQALTGMTLEKDKKVIARLYQLKEFFIQRGIDNGIK
jgi:hypothetical protein